MQSPSTKLSGGGVKKRRATINYPAPIPTVASAVHYIIYTRDYSHPWCSGAQNDIMCLDLPIDSSTQPRSEVRYLPLLLRSPVGTINESPTASSGRIRFYQFWFYHHFALNSYVFHIHILYIMFPVFTAERKHVVDFNKKID